MIVLRPDQQILKNSVYTDWNNNIQNVLAVLSTGGGKSIIASDIVLDYAQLGYQTAVVAHRNELVSQMSEHIANRGITHKIIGSDSTVKQIRQKHHEKYGRSFINMSSPTAVVGVDTMVARKKQLKDWAVQTDRWIIDEAHHVISDNKWGKAIKMFPNAKGLGITATPLRADGQGLGREFDGVFDTMHVGLEMRQLILNKSLSDYEIVCPVSDLNIENESVSASGDWSSKKLKTAAKKSRITGDVVQAYCQYALVRQTICFATDVETAGEISDKFNNIGIKAVSLSGKTPSTVRDKYIREFKSGKLQILINVDLFDEGFDVPACDVVIMARPTASLGKYRQMVGRALRYMANKVALIIDLVSNVIRHGLPDKVIEWTLARRDKRGKQEKDPDEIELKPCKHCLKPYEKFLIVCPYCGLAPPLPVATSRSIEQVDGDLILLDREKLEEMRKACEIESPASVAERTAHVAGKFAATGSAKRQVEKIEAHTELKNAIAQWAGIERLHGFSDRELYKKFYLTTGVDVLSALDGKKTRQEFETLTEKVKRWYL